MSIIKIIFITALLTLLLGCADEETSTKISNKTFTINDVFGIKIGTVDANLPEGYIIENKSIPFKPKTPDNRFVKYQYSTTPKSHVIYGITTKSSRELSKENCLEQRGQLIEETLKELENTPELKITEEKNKWKAREANQRQITIDCEISVSPKELQLVMIYQDTALSLKAFKEWKKRQKEITLIRF